MAEESLGRAAAVTALAPIAGRLADERARQQAEEELRRQLGEALAAAPLLERPAEPVPDLTSSFGECVPVMIGWTCGLFLPMFWIVNAVPALVNHHNNVGYANPLLALFFSALLGLVLGGRRLWRAQYRLDSERRVYEQQLSAAEVREAERESIRARFEAGALADEESR